MGSTRSPLDPLVQAFLRFVAEEEPGFSPAARARVERCAATMEVPPELIDALFVSAKSRGFLQPIPHGRVRMRWQVSAAGRAFLTADEAEPAELTSAAGVQHG